MEEFRQYFKFPLKQDKYAKSIVWTEDGNRAFDFLSGEREAQKKLVSLINGYTSTKPGNKFVSLEGVVYVDGAKLLRIRSWGNLTGVNGYNLSPEKAQEMQYVFSDFITKQLSK